MGFGMNKFTQFCTWSNEDIYFSIRNISLYCKNTESNEPLIKEATMFLYKIIHEKSDLKLTDLVENSEDLHFLKDS